MNLIHGRPQPRVMIKNILLLIALAIGIFWLAGCQEETPTPAPPTPILTATQPLPTAVPATPTPASLGSSQNPIQIGVVRDTGQTDQATAAPDALAALLSTETGETIRIVPFSTYPELLEAMTRGSIQAAWLPPLTYLNAYQNAIAQVGLVSNHFGVYRYGTQFLANVDDKYTVYYDPAKNQSTADAADALRQFAGKRPCWVDATSASGYVLPMGVLATESIQPGPPVVTQDHTAVIRALYTHGICDFGATFAIIGDPRTSSTIQKDMPDVMQKVVVVWQTPAVIPNLNLSYAWQLPQAVRSKLSDTLLNIARTKDGQAALTAATGVEIAGLKPADNSFYNDLMGYVQASGIDTSTLVGK